MNGKGNNSMELLAFENRDIESDKILTVSVTAATGAIRYRRETKRVINRHGAGSEEVVMVTCDYKRSLPDILLFSRVTAKNKTKAIEYFNTNKDQDFSILQELNRY